MADDFGLRIGLEGEKEFKKALSDINQSFRVLGSEMRLVDSEFDRNDKSVEALTARNQVLNREIEAQKQKIETLRAALDNAAESFGENDRRTQNWQMQLNNAQAELNAMERSLRQNEEALENSSEGFDEAAENADDFADDINDAADNADKAGGKLEKLGSIAKGVGVALATAFAAVGAAAISAAKSLTTMSVDAAAYADEILTASTVTGMSTESLQAYKYAADLVDVSLDTLTKSMAKQVKSMDSARDGSSAYAEAYQTLGVSVTDANGNLRDSETVYWECIDALKNIENETERNSVAMQIFGKSAQELNPLIAQGSSGIAELTEEAKRMGAVMSEDALSSLGSFDDSIQRLKAGSSAAKNALGTVLLPELQLLADGGVDLIGEFTRGINETNGDWGKISEVIGNSIGSLAQMVLDALPKIITTVQEILTALLTAITDNLPMIVESAGQIVFALLQGLIDSLPQIADGALQLVLTLVDGLIANLPLLIEAAMKAIATLAKGLADAFPTLIPALVKTVVNICKTLIDNMPLILDAALQLISGLAEGVLEALPVLIAALPEIINSIITFLLDSIPLIIQTGIQLLTSLVAALPDIITAIVAAIPLIIENIITAVMAAIPQIIQAGIDLLVSLIQALPEIITTIVKAIPQIISGIINAVLGNIDKIIMAGVELLVSLVANLPQIITEIVKAIPKIITGIVDAISGSIGKIIEVGGNLIKGLWQGISDAGAWLWDQISGFFGGIVDGIKDFFGIHSPSRLFASLGGFMAEGLGEGFGDEMKAVSKDMQNAIPSDFDLDMNSNITGFEGVGQNGALDVTIPLTIDGITLTKVISRIQWSQNKVVVRNMGVG